jgi:type I restriction enzyme R subunit
VYFPDAEGGKLRLIEYRDYLAEETRRLFKKPGDLEAVWKTGPGREEVAQALLTRGISLDEAAQRLQLEELDPLDLLVHVAWNRAAVTRRERTRRVRADERAFFDSFSPAAHEVLNELLDKYASFGIAELDDLRVLETPPINEHGNVIEIAQLFGGTSPLRSAVEQLKALLYSA